MRVQYHDDGTADVFLRQSWITDARDCLEKGRFTMNQPDLAVPSEAALIGTSVHAGAEAYCLDDLLTVNEVVDASVTEWEQLLTQPVKWVKYTEAQARAELIALSQAWYRELRPYVTAPIGVEQEFCFQFTTFWFGDMEVRVWFKGTIDLVQPDSVWDWKTSKKKYSWRDKQSDNIQSTVYAAAAVAHGWHSWDVPFKFGVLVREQHVAQIVHITRTPSHVEWLTRLIEPMVRLAVAIGPDQSWPMNDSHGLCNEVWCPYWAQCKGRFLAPVPFPQSRKAST